MTMGTRGPKPLPTALRILNGNAAHRPLPKNEPKPEKLKNTKPPFELTERGKKIWKTISKRLEVCGLLTNIDLNALMRYCDIFDKWLLAKEMYDTKGSYYEVFNGGKSCGYAKAPWAVEYRGFLRELLRLEGEFGMTPSARTRIQLEVTEKKQDEFDQFLSKRARG
jgi:P27 family predicted phage terminase small subunit